MIVFAGAMHTYVPDHVDRDEQIAQVIGLTVLNVSLEKESTQNSEPDGTVVKSMHHHHHRHHNEDFL